MAGRNIPYTTALNPFTAALYLLLLYRNLYLTLIPSKLSPKRECSRKRVKKSVFKKLGIKTMSLEFLGQNSSM